MLPDAIAAQAIVIQFIKHEETHEELSLVHVKGPRCYSA